MRRIALLIGIVLFAAPLFAGQPTESEVNAQYGKYLEAVCGQDCPLGVRDMQARIRILQEYCRRMGPGPTCPDVLKWDPLPALIYDHNTGLWRAEAALEERTELDVNGAPTTDLARGKSLVVVIENTNPLLYRATAGKIELKPIEQFSDLQKLAGLFGGNAAALLKVEEIRRARADLPSGATGISAPVVDRTAEALQNAADQFVAGQRLADCVTLRAQAATAFVQAVESGRDETYPSPPDVCMGLDASAKNVRGQTSMLGAARDLVRRRCVELPEAVQNLLNLVPDSCSPAPPVPDEATLRKALEAYDDSAGSLGCSSWGDPIPEQAGLANPPSVRGELEDKIVERLRTAVEASSPPDDLRRLFCELETVERGGVDRLVLAARAGNAIEKGLETLIASLPTLGKTAENLDLFRERVIENVIGEVADCNGATPPPCVSSSSVATFIVLPGEPSRVTRWESIHSRTVKVVTDSPYAGDVVARRDKSVETGFSVRSPLASVFDIGLGITATDIDSPKFGAVREDPEVFGSDSKFVVGVTDEESQTGKVALLLNVVPLRLFDVPKLVQPLGLQLGASVDTSKPALFWGLSYGLGKYVRIGWGRTSQQVNMLRDETPLGSRVANKDEIRTRQEYVEDDYWSLTISIRTLRLFSN